MLHHIRAAYRISLTDPYILKEWWAWKWSWVVAGGPVGRWGRAVWLGYRALQREWDAKEGKRGYVGEKIERPDLGILATVLFAALLGVFTLVSPLLAYRVVNLSSLHLSNPLNCCVIGNAGTSSSDVSQHHEGRINPRCPHEEISSS